MTVTELMIKEVLRYIATPEQEASRQLIEQIEKTYEKLDKIAVPKHIYRLFDIEKNENEIRFLSTPFCVSSNDLSKVLSHSKRCYLMAATLGLEVDRQISRLQRMNMLEAVIMDACASVLIEKVCDTLESSMIKDLKENEFLTMRYSPGYGDVAIEVQKQLTEVLETPKTIGLSVSKNCLMLPSKSITAFIGIADKKQNRQKSCNMCNLKGVCSYRERGDRCGIK